MLEKSAQNSFFRAIFFVGHLSHQSIFAILPLDDDPESYSRGNFTARKNSQVTIFRFPYGI